MNNLNLSIRALPMQQLLPVRSLDELEHLVKESEVLTGAPGRTFVELPRAGKDAITPK